MKYAVISDIHGNLPALKAVLADAAAQNVDGYFFLGDYYEDFPYPNKVVDTVRGLRNAWVVRGNKEDYLCSLAGEDPATWTFDQNAILYWNYRNLTEENRRYLMELPASLTVPLVDGATAMLTHSSKSVFGVPEAGMMRPIVYADRAGEEGVPRDEFYAGIKQEVTSQLTGLKESGAPDCQVYLFGHTHLQWHLELGDKLFLNPGACGLPLDCNTDAPYTILDWNEQGRRVAERRVPYDLPGLIRAMKSSDIYEKARLWCDLITLELADAKEHLHLFFDVAEAMATERGENLWPMPNATFREAFKIWYPEQKKTVYAIE